MKTHKPKKFSSPTVSEKTIEASKQLARLGSTQKLLKPIPRRRSHFDYQSWIGLGLKAPLASKPRFKNEDDL